MTEVRQGYELDSLVWLDGRTDVLVCSEGLKCWNWIIQNMDLKVSLFNEEALCLLWWLMEFFGDDSRLCDSSIRNALRRLIRRRTCPAGPPSRFLLRVLWGPYCVILMSLESLTSPTVEMARTTKWGIMLNVFLRWVIFQHFIALLTPREALFYPPRWSVKM